MIAPTMLGLLVLNIYPFFKTIHLSLHESQGLGLMDWAGVANYSRMLRDGVVWRAVGNTLYFTLLSVPMGIALSLVMAVLINSLKRGTALFRTLFFLPMVVAPAALSMVWCWLLNKEMGIVNYLLSLGGIGKIGWLSDPRFSLFSVAMVSIWSSVGYNLIIFSSGLKSIPGSYYEAAQIDGASRRVQFFRITVPLISPTLFFVMITTMMKAVKEFDMIYVMLGQDNPAIEKSQTILFLFFKHAFITQEKGYASAVVVFAFLLIALITAVQFLYQKKWVHY